MGFEYLTNVPLAKAKEDYVNHTVTAGYNEETGQVIIIG